MFLYVAKYIDTDDCTYSHTSKEIFIAKDDDEAFEKAKKIDFWNNLEDVEKLNQIDGYEITLTERKSDIVVSKEAKKISYEKFGIC